MNRLSTSTLSELPHDVIVPEYDSASITARIVHFGIGNFHRAHQAVYCEALLNMGHKTWGIIGVSMRSPAIRDKLKPQNFLYTQATLGETNTYQVIGAIQNVLVAPENPQAVIDTVARNQTQLVTTTITEKGYCLSSGKIDFDHPSVQADLQSLEEPQTCYGYIAAALIKRAANDGSALTVLCCDNLHGGGEHLRRGVEMLIQKHNQNSLAWAQQNIAFLSSMVDRVTPATSDSFKRQVTDKISLIDTAPVAAEPFTQWVINGQFAGKRPPFDQAGALFVQDIEPYENVKLRFLNAGHSILAVLGYLAGDEFIHEALQRPILARFTEYTLKRNVLPVTPIPEGINGEAYIDQVLQRFRNTDLPYALLQVGCDSSQKIQHRWLPSIDDALRMGEDASYLAFSLAAWVSFIRKALIRKELNDPLIDAFSKYRFSGNASDVSSVLSITGVDRFAFFDNNAYMKTVELCYLDINNAGIVQAIKDLPYNQT